MLFFYEMQFLSLGNIYIFLQVKQQNYVSFFFYHRRSSRSRDEVPQRDDKQVIMR